MNAFRLFIPSGWQFQGGVGWLNDNPGMPAVVAFQVLNPAGLEAFEVFPNQSFYWTNNPMSLMTFPIGSRYYGNEVRPPMNAQQSLRQIVLPRFRSNQQVTILKEEHLPDLPNQVRTSPVDPNVPLMADGAKVRIRYPSNSEVSDPNSGESVELPNGYAKAWSTPLGDYIISDDPDFNPNRESSQTWTPLERQNS